MLVPKLPENVEGTTKRGLLCFSFAFVSFANPEDMEEAYDANESLDGYHISKYDRPEKMKKDNLRVGRDITACDNFMLQDHSAFLLTKPVPEHYPSF